jgi:hypothetical protein
MAKGKKQTAPRCCACKKLMKGVIHEVALLGGSALSKMCDRCYHATLQCDVCFNLTSFADGAINNQDKETNGVNGDGIICPDCSGVNTGLALVIEKSREVLDEGDKIEAIMIVRRMTADIGLQYGLRDAKELVETYDDSTSCKDLAEAWEAKTTNALKHCKSCGGMFSLLLAGNCQKCHWVAQNKMPYTCCACNKRIDGDPIMFEGDGVCESCARTKTGAHVKATVPVSAKPTEKAPMAQKIAWLHATYPHVFDEHGKMIFRPEESND